ncbi:MAG: hypothetical protein B6I20_14530 [Bacteroidetes bacterium 4572_117]|nr:MAG: hypothetical protein B6I20_14530 [Bacteroidetes bacterium 4572_117]
MFGGFFISILLAGLSNLRTPNVTGEYQHISVHAKIRLVINQFKKNVKICNFKKNALSLHTKRSVFNTIETWIQKKK